MQKIEATTRIPKPTRCLRPEDYTVAWIAALPVELKAALHMLDEEHFSLPQRLDDPVAYTLGSINIPGTPLSHNIVLACLPAGRSGTNSAATIATWVKSRFPCLQFCILVGIAGGVPFPHNIRLGDIVVSQPRKGPAVVQYDLGKDTTNGFERTGVLNQPPALLLNVLSLYQARNFDRGGNSTSHEFKPANDEYLKSQELPELDLLFAADYDHIGQDACCDCDQGYLLKPVEHGKRKLMVHYGAIASGNKVIKNGRIRDEISKALSQDADDILCFEMEAAGVMDVFPCLVIRGICDYADSHKNKAWQSYAATTSAVFARDLLQFVPVRQSSSLSSSSTLGVRSISPQASHSKGNSGSAYSRTSYQDIVLYDFTLLENLSGYDAARTQRAFAQSRAPGTTKWILQHGLFKEWCQSNDSACIWLTGKIGCGKTLITSTIIEYLLVKPPTQEMPRLVLHYFCRHSYIHEATADGIFNSFTRQLLEYFDDHNREYPKDIRRIMLRYYGCVKERLSCEEICEMILEPLVNNIRDVTMIIDGLDECQSTDINRVLDIISKLLQRQQVRIKILVSGRPSLEIRESIPGTRMIDLVGHEIAQDIATYINWQVDKRMDRKPITKDPNIRRHIVDTLTEKADRMILWVRLQLDNLWEDCSTDAEIREALSNLPTNLKETYERCIQKIVSRAGAYKKQYAIKILPWIMAAPQPFTMIQLQQALALNHTTGCLEYDRLPLSRDVLKSCSNLVLADNDSDEPSDSQLVQLAHHSVRQFLNALDEYWFDRNTVPISVRQFFEALESQWPYVRGFPLEQNSARLSLGGICVHHLASPDYGLAVQRIDSQNLRLEVSDFDRLIGNVPWIIRYFLPEPKPINIRVPMRQTRLQRTKLPEFFHFARRHWPGLTSEITEEHDQFLRFKNLSLEQNLTWRIHPWQPLGQSDDSHRFGLLGWSIVQKHRPMFELLFASNEARLKPELFSAPFVEYHNHHALRLAVMYNAAWAIQRMIEQLPLRHVKALLSYLDHDGRNALHIAAANDFYGLIEILSSTIGVPIVADSRGVWPLFLAASAGHHRTIKELLKLKSRISDSDLTTSIGVAISNGHDKALEILWKYSSYSVMTVDSATAVIEAASRGYIRTIKLVLPRAPVAYGWPSLVLLAAVQTGQSSIVDFILDNYANLESTLIEQAFLTAIKNRYISIGERILTTVLDCESEWKCTGRLILHNAISSGYSEVVQTFLRLHKDLGYDIDVDLDGLKLSAAMQPLKIVVRSNDLDLARILLSFGADPCALGGSGKVSGTPIHAAALSGTSEMFELFLEYCNDWNIRDKQGQTPLMLVTKTGNMEKLYALTKKSVFDDSTHRSQVELDLQDYDGYTAFFLCCKYEEQGIDAEPLARHLLKLGATLDIRNKSGHTVMDWLTVERSRINLMLVLAQEAGFSLDMTDLQGRTALHIAIMMMDLKTAAKLVAQGASMSARDEDGQTPVHLSTFTRADSIHWIDALSKSNPPQSWINIVDNNGNSALHLAVRYRRQNTIRQLLARGACWHQKNMEQVSPHDLALEAGLGHLFEEAMNREGLNKDSDLSVEKDEPK